MTRPLGKPLGRGPSSRFVSHQPVSPAPGGVVPESDKAVLYSVIVPAFNAAADLRGCLMALARQSVNPARYEVIVVDDGSTDDTARIALDFAKRRTVPCFRLVRVAHSGPAAARNAGAREARGDLLLFTDADCEPLRNWIAEITKPLEEDRRVAAAKGRYLTRQTGLLARFTQLELEEKYHALKRKDSIDFIDTYSAAFRRDAFWSGGAFDPSFPAASNEDTLLSFNLYEKGHRLVFAERALVYHRHATSLNYYLLRKLRHGFYRIRVYRLHPGKIRGDSYTPRSTQIQLATATLLPLALFIWALGGSALLPLGVALLFLISTVPFIRRAIRQGPTLSLSVPVILLLRAWALALGLGAGALSLIRSRSLEADHALIAKSVTVEADPIPRKEPQENI